ncbi:MAG: hypothetical protein MJZ74_02490 [Muribaculaceae bacterium]|nr:hypothetical protein [Muribaculaceae bacterium]
MLEKIKNLFDYLMDRYEWLLTRLLKINSVKVKRERYVRRVVRRFYSDENEEEMVQKALDTSLSQVLTEEQQRKCYKSIINRFAVVVFVTSFVTSFPEDLWSIVVAIVVDLAIFQVALYIAMQQIMQLYGEGLDLTDHEDEGVEMIASIESSGLMLGKFPILQRMKSVVGWLSKQLVKRLGPRYIAKVSRTLFIVIRRQAIKWFSIVLAKQDIELFFNMIIPTLCAIISGIVSVIIFVPMCNKLKKHLLEQAAKESETETETVSPETETAEA